MLKLNYIKRKREISQNKIENDKIYYQSFNELISLLHLSLDNIPRVIPVIELLIDLYLPSKLSSDTIYSTNEFLKFNVENEEIFKYYIHSDLEMFYKLKKIIISIQNNQSTSNDQINYYLKKIK